MNRVSANNVTHLHTFTAHLGDKLDAYMEEHFGDLVKIYRNKERDGLIKTRTSGAKFATGEVIVFLDAHCECNRNWLPPLLARIVADKLVITTHGIELLFAFNILFNYNYLRGI